MLRVLRVLLRVLLSGVAIALLLSTCNLSSTARTAAYSRQFRGLKVSPPGPRQQKTTTTTASLSTSAIPFPPPAALGSLYSVITTHSDVQHAVKFFLARDVCIPHIRPEHAAWNDYGGKLQIFMPPQPPCNSTDAQPGPECAQRDDITAKITGRGYLMGNAHHEVLFGVPVPSRTNASVTWHSGLTAILRPAVSMHVWHLWETVGMMWHLILHPEQYEFVQHIDQVVAPISADDELAYNQDLLAVLLAAINKASKVAITLSTQSSMLRTNPGMHCFERVIVPGIVDADYSARIHASPQDAARVRHFIFNHFHTPFLPHGRTRSAQADVGHRTTPNDTLLAPVRVAFENRCPGSRCLQNHKEVLEYLKASSIGPFLDFGGHQPTVNTTDVAPSPSSDWLVALASLDGNSKGVGHRDGTSAIRTTDGSPVSGPTFSFGKFSFADQVAIAGNVDVWLGVNGAAVANAVLMRPNSVLMVMQPLQPRGHHSWFERTALASGHRYFSTPLYNVSSCPACDTVPDSWLRTVNNPNLPLGNATGEQFLAGTGRASGEGADANTTSKSRVCEGVFDCKFTVTPAELRLVEDTLRQAVLHVYTVKRNVSFTLPPLHEERPERLYSYVWGK